MSEAHPVVVKVDAVREIEHGEGRWHASYKPLTPSMEPRGGSLGVNLTRVGPGRSVAPFHYHQREDEAFYVLSGTGVLRYGDEVFALRPGDCISCPAGTRIAHQIANDGTEDLVYLAMGINDPNEICVYPDSGKVMVRSLKRVGHLREAPYMDGEPETPKIFELAAAKKPRT